MTKKTAKKILKEMEKANNDNAFNLAIKMAIEYDNGARLAMNNEAPPSGWTPGQQLTILMTMHTAGLAHLIDNMCGDDIPGRERMTESVTNQVRTFLMRKIQPTPGQKLN